MYELQDNVQEMRNDLKLENRPRHKLPYRGPLPYSLGQKGLDVRPYSTRQCPSQDNDFGGGII